MPDTGLFQVMVRDSGLCLHCNRLPTAYDRRSRLYYQYCGKTCAMLASALPRSKLEVSKRKVCKHCRVCSRAWDSQRGRSLNYCSKACAHAASAAKAGAHRLHAPTHRVPRTIRRSPIHFFHSRAPYFNFTNESLHPVAYKGIIYPTAQHVFLAMKFLSKYPDIAEFIRRRSSTEDARQEARKYRAYIRADWFSESRGRTVHMTKMEEVLFLKFQQHPDLGEELVSTSEAELVFENPVDAFWGVGYNNKGRNEFGKALMRLRKHILDQTQAPKRQRRV